MPLDKNKLLNLVAAGETQKAIDEILTHKEDVLEPLYNEVVKLSAELAVNYRGYSLVIQRDDILGIQRKETFDLMAKNEFFLIYEVAFRSNHKLKCRTIGSYDISLSMKGNFCH